MMMMTMMIAAGDVMTVMMMISGDGDAIESLKSKQDHGKSKQDQAKTKQDHPKN